MSFPEMIPFELKIFSYIYECGRILTPILALAWFVYALWLMIRLNRRFFLWLLVFPCVILPLQIGFTWCGWHYRMELRDRYARDKTGWTDSFTEYPVNVRKMPPAILAEYAKHDYHPRFRDIKAQIVGCIVMLPVVYFFGLPGWCVSCLIREQLEKRGKDGPEEST
ncbi:MAG: hypothetical protein J5898_00150 [Lachnospiraceae bacterium]|nr:hypothetical protein [Lachnospiraceae bacterium]